MKMSELMRLSKTPVDNMTISELTRLLESNLINDSNYHNLIKNTLEYKLYEQGSK